MDVETLKPHLSPMTRVQRSGERMPEVWRKRTVRFAELYSTRLAAYLYGVHISTVNDWRRRYGPLTVDPTYERYQRHYERYA